MKCIKCGQQIENNSKFCNFCGNQVCSVEIFNDDIASISDATPKNNLKKFSKSKLMSFMIISVIAVIAIIIFIINSNRLDTNEKYAIDKVEEYKNMLKNPDSIKLWSDILIIRTAEKNDIDEDAEIEYHTYCYFMTSGENGFGASVKSLVYFYDGKYYCDLDEDGEGYKMDNIYLHGKLYYLRYGLDGDDIVKKVNDVKECVTIKSSLVGRKLKIPYEK